MASVKGIGLLAGLVMTTAVFAAPKIEFPVSDYYFGKIKEGDKASYNYKFTNKGTDTLIMESVKASCGCTAALLSKKTLAPGESGDVAVTFNSAGRPGNVQKTIYVKCNDPAKPDVNLNMRGFVVSEIAAKPASIQFAATGENEVVKRTFTVDNPTEQEIKVLSVKSNTPAISVDLNPLDMPMTVAAGKNLVVNLEITPNSMEKGWKKLGTVEILTSSKAKPKLEVNVEFSR